MSLQATFWTCFRPRAQERYGSIDIWINNAGTNGYTYVPMFEQAPDQLREIVATNVLGVMLSCRAAIRVMREQPTGGHIFNMGERRVMVW